MTHNNSSKILKLATLKPYKNERDTLLQNHDGIFINVHNAPLIRALAKGLGVQFNIVIPEDNKIGIRNTDGTWTGMIGMLARGEAALSASALTVNDERREKVNFSYPLHVTDITFMTNLPEPHPKSFAIFDVFSFELWIGIGLCLILISLFLYLLLKSSETYSTILVDCIGSLLEKSFSIRLRQNNTALLLYFWILGITILTTSYKAVILSLITVPRMTGIRDIADLSEAARENSVMCMTYKGSALWRYTSNDERLKFITECLKRGEESLHSNQDFYKYPYKKAFIADRFDLMRFSNEYYISDDSFSLTHIAIALSKTFCCRKKLDRVINRIVAADLYPKIFRDKYFMLQLSKLKLESNDFDDTHLKSLTLKDFTGAFIVLIIGYLCSLVTFTVEIISKYVTLKLLN